MFMYILHIEPLCTFDRNFFYLCISISKAVKVRLFHILTERFTNSVSIGLCKVLKKTSIHGLHGMCAMFTQILVHLQNAEHT